MCSKLLTKLDKKPDGKEFNKSETVSKYDLLLKERENIIKRSK
jgi:hypothetical protein